MKRLEQDNNTVEEYYDNLCTALFRLGLEECEDDFLNRFWRGLNHDIQDVIMHEELYLVDHLFCLARKAEQKIRTHAYTMNQWPVESPSRKIPSFVAPTSMIAPLVAYEASPSNRTYFI